MYDRPLAKTITIALKQRKIIRMYQICCNKDYCSCGDTYQRLPK